MDREMDGRGDRTGCEMGEERCDVCQGRPRGEKRRRIRVGTGNAGEEGRQGSGNEGREESGDEGRQESGDKVSDQCSIAQDDIDQQEIWDEDEEMEESCNGLQQIQRQQQVEQKAEEVRLQGEFESEMARHEQMRRERVARSITQEVSAEEMEEVFKSWQGICSVCRAKGLDDENHTTADCTKISHEEREYCKAAQEWMDSVEVERFSGCKFCWAPQAVCHLWGDAFSKGRWGYRMAKGRRCRFPRVLRDASAVLHNADWKRSVSADWIEEEMDRFGFDRATEGMDEGAKFKKWMERKVRMGGIEMSEMCRVFYIWGM